MDIVEIIERINDLENKIDQTKNNVEKLFLTEDLNRYYTALGKVYYQKLLDTSDVKNGQ